MLRASDTVNLGLRVSRTANSKLVGNRRDLNFFATYREVGSTCPSTCPLLNAGCYAQQGKVHLAGRGRVSRNDGEVFLSAVRDMPKGAMVRLHVSGDVMADGKKTGSNKIDIKYLRSLIKAAKSRPDVTFYGYTHAWYLIDRNKFKFPKNLVLNASCDNDKDVVVAKALGWDVVTVWPETVTKRRIGNTVVCPNQTSGLSCAECKLCMKPNRVLDVAFLAHGVSKKKISARVRLD